MFRKELYVGELRTFRRGLIGSSGGLVSKRKFILRGMKIEEKGFERLFLLFLLFISVFFSDFPLVSSSNSLVVQGMVIDGSTGRTLENATIAAYDVSRLLLISSTRTNSSGGYELVLQGTYGFRIYAYYDDLSTPGFDYMPSMRAIPSTGGTVNVSFSLIPGATVKVEGEIMIVSSSETAENYLFTVCDPWTGEPLKSGDYVLCYGTGLSSQSEYVGLDPKELIVPAFIPFNINVSSSLRVKEVSYGRTAFVTYPFDFLIDEPSHFNLSQGQFLELDVRKYALPPNIEIVDEFLQGLRMRLDILEEKGFYLVEEMRDFQSLLGYAEMGETEYSQLMYDGCYASLRQAYIEASELDERLDSVSGEAAQSMWVLTFLLSFTSMALASVLTESGRWKGLISFLFYVFLLLVLYLVYPGFRVLEGSELMWTLVLPLLLVLGVVFLLPYRYRRRIAGAMVGFGSTLVATSSLAKRNLRRRGLRSSLSIFTVAVLAMGFVSLTSIYTGYGLIVRSAEAEGLQPAALLVRRTPLPEITFRIDGTIVVHPRFRPLDPFIVDWLENRSEVGLVAPKVMNRVPYSPIGTMGSMETKRSLLLNGFLGVLPSAEALITRLNETVVEGRFLSDGDTDAVLISVSTGDALGINLNANLTIRIETLTGEEGRVFRVVGFFDDDAISRLRDLDGESLLPKKMVTRSMGSLLEYVPFPCDPDEIFVTTLDAALSLGGLVSGVDVLLDSPQSVVPLGRTAVLNYDCVVWGRAGNQLYTVYLGSFYEAKGALLLIPLVLVVLNVVIGMLNSVYERRKEISILSSVGLNPKHIAMIFVAESLIIGIIGGSLGYLSGLGFYRVMVAFNINLGVREKVSALWSFCTLGICLTAALVGVAVALKWSLVVTPSVIRRWTMKGRGFQLVKPWFIGIPVDLSEGSVESFLEYVEGVLRRSENPDWRVVRVKLGEERTDREIRRTVGFTVFSPPDLSKNLLVAKRRVGEEKYGVELISEASGDMAYRTAEMIRSIVLGWSTEKSRIKRQTE